MSNAFEPDELHVDGSRYLFQGGVWTDEGGMNVSMVRSQEMSMLFFEEHGRSPRREPDAAAVKRARKKAATDKAAALRAAIAKAQDAKAANGD